MKLATVVVPLVMGTPAAAEGPYAGGCAGYGFQAGGQIFRLEDVSDGRRLSGSALHLDNSRYFTLNQRGF
ncbi:hypothetical protein [Shinella fusca]|uniref:Uncharacterized protein n=1 Tax=Shinella fusca TaxID=544480 RepID=A0A7W7YR42_9HYPH|nr:hypothetical protein [Shinella fusca]MBB5040795.1 hypothetical protein [Shinella fusca]